MGGDGVVINGGSVSYPYINMSTPSAGMVRYNGNNQNMEVYDGSRWLTLATGYPTIELTPEIQTLLDWARKKRAEEIERDFLAATNPTVKDLIRQIEEKEEQIRIVQTLLKEEVKVEAS